MTNKIEFLTFKEANRQSVSDAIIPMYGSRQQPPACLQALGKHCGEVLAKV